MKKILFLFLLISSYCHAQYPPGYTGINSRYDWLSGKFRALHAPSGSVPALQTGQWSGAGALFVDTSGGGIGLYYYNGLNWIRLRDTTEAGGGGSGTDNANVGSGFRLLKPGTQQVKTIFAAWGVDLDSTTNTDGITIKIDSTEAASKSYVDYKSDILNGSKVDKNATITGATKTKITYDAKGLVTAGADAGIADITGLQTALDAKLPINDTSKFNKDFTVNADSTKFNGWVNVMDFGVVSDSTTNQRTALVNAINYAAYYKKKLFIPGIYILCNGVIVLPAGSYIEGEGTGFIKTTSNDRIFQISDKSIVDNLNFRGSGSAAGLTFQTGISIYQAIGYSISNCTFTRFSGPGQHNGGGGIYGSLAAVANSDGGRISNCYFYDNNGGLVLSQRAEYVNITNCTFGNNVVAVGWGGGNLNMVGAIIHNNRTGFKNFSGTNNAHGSVSASIINHNDLLLDVQDVSYSLGMKFSTVQMFLGSMRFKNANNITFDNCTLSDIDSIGVDNSTNIQMVNTFVGLTTGGAVIPINYYNGSTEIAFLGRMRAASATPTYWIKQVNADTVYLSGPVGIGADPVASSLVNISSTTKGFLTPRMTSSQRTSISSPATGLEVYDTDSLKKFVYNGSAWKSLANTTDIPTVATPTLQQVITADPILTGTNEIDASGFDLSFINIGTLSSEAITENRMVSINGAHRSDLSVRSDSIRILPDEGKLNIDSLRTLAAGDDEMMTWNPRTGVVSHQAIPSGGGTYVDGGSFSTSTNYLTLTQTGSSPDIGIRIPPSYLINPVNVDSLVYKRNDSVALIKSVTVSSANSKISVSTTRTDSTINHQVTVNEANFTTLAPLASPTFTGTPAAPTAAANTNTTQVATTAFVNAERSNTATLSNKRWTPRVGSTTSSATPTINTDNVDIYKLTAQTADITSFTTNLTGTPVDGDILEIQITGTAARAITWGSAFVASTVALPTTTVTTATLTVVFQYYTTSSYGNNKWVCASSY